MNMNTPARVRGLLRLHPDSFPTRGLFCQIRNLAESRSLAMRGMTMSCVLQAFLRRCMMTRLMLITCTGFWLPSALFLTGCNSFSYFGDATPSLEATRYQYAKAHPTNEFNSSILSGKIQKGMESQQVLVSWGTPDFIGAGDQPNIDQTWAYHESDPSRGPITYLLRFRRGVLQDVDTLRGIQYAGTNDVEAQMIPEEVVTSANRGEKSPF